MAVWAIKRHIDLSDAFILAPERYNPRREVLSSLSAASGKRLIDVVHLVRNVVNENTSGLNRCLVMDTSHAQEGRVISPKRIVHGSELGSAKKALSANDVIISRLRPYLRQVAFVDKGIRGWEEGVHLLCSTEFFVMRSADGLPISFLVPYLLSHPVQQALANSQEGGHHPRFTENALLSLSVPAGLLERRKEISDAIERQASFYRQSEADLHNLTGDVEKIFKTPESQATLRSH